MHMPLASCSGRHIHTHSSILQCSKVPLGVSQCSLAFVPWRFLAFPGVPLSPQWCLLQLTPACHQQQVHECLAYLACHPDLGLTYQHGPVGLARWTDADYCGCLDTSCSTSGWLFTPAGDPISWPSKQQRGTADSTADSTAEAEYRAVLKCNR